MNILKDKGYSATCKDLAPTSNSYPNLMNKVLKLYKIKGKKDKGYDGVRMAAKREWEKYLEQEKRTGNKKGNRRGKREQEGTEEENSDSEGEESAEESEEDLEEVEEEGTGNREQKGTKGNREQKKERKREPEEEEEEMKKTKGDSHSVS